VFGLIAYPLVYDVALALTDAEGFEGPGRFVGLATFGGVLASREFWIAANNSLAYTLATASLRLVLGVGLALLIWRLRRARSIVFIAVFIPWVFPAALSAFAFYWLLSPPFHTFYTMSLLNVRWFVADLLGQDLWHVGAIALHDVWRSSAFLAIFVLAGLNSLPTDPLDYARIECSSAWRRFWLVVMPMLRRFLVLALMLSLVISFMDFASIYVQTGGRISWPLLGTLAYQRSFLHGETAVGAAITLVQLPVWLLILWFAFRLFERDPQPTSLRAADESPSSTSRAVDVLDVDKQPAQRAGASRPRGPRLPAALWLAPAGVLAVVFAVFPIWWIFLQAIRPSSEDRFGNPFWTWAPTLRGFEDVIEGRMVGIWLLNTFIILAIGVTLTLVSGVLAGYALGRLRVPGRRWIARLLFASYFLPQPMVLVPIYQVFLTMGLDNTLVAVILLNQTLTIPFATWLFFTYFDGLPADVEEHATLDGSRLEVFRHIVLPMSWPVIIAAGIFSVGVMASDFIYAGLLLVHNDVKTIAVGLGLIGISLDEFVSISGGIGMAATPLIIICAALAPAYVRGLSAAMIEGS
jgi:multiple sugar transport system permease protein